MLMKMKYLFLCLAVAGLIAFHDVHGQAKVRKMSTTINHPSLNIFAPYISADANAIVFLSDNAEDNALTPFFSFRETGDWREPEVLPKTIHTRLSFLRGYSLSADGSKLWFSTMKSPGVGGFDIWLSDWRGTVWANPVNPGAPINSRAHEACPSLSTSCVVKKWINTTQVFAKSCASTSDQTERGVSPLNCRRTLTPVTHNRHALWRMGRRSSFPLTI
jgi:hypothetical protein